MDELYFFDAESKKKTRTLKVKMKHLKNLQNGAKNKRCEIKIKKNKSKTLTNSNENFRIKKN